MKVISPITLPFFVVALLITMASSFSTMTVQNNRMMTQRRPAFLLKYTVIAGLDEEEIEESHDEDARDLMRKAGKENYSPETLAGYQDFNALDGENHINVDSYSNPAGGIVPGFQLSSLCEDD
mmetsp:Transcript_4646/g.6874  ORF Transcript_4646/g.6874 Transcript_4646/m.6874 type:complete len:123 (+) Transcript_4646:98-466(+)